MEVILVDGFGHPRRVDLIDEDPPLFLQYAHEGMRSGLARRVLFDRCDDERREGCPVYRQHGMGTPDIRDEYLRPADERSVL